MIMDRLPLVQALTAAGLERSGAEQVATALGDAIDSSVATRSDIQALKNDISALRGDFGASRVESKGDLALLRSELKGELASLRRESKADLAALRSELKGDQASLEMRIIVRLGAMIVGSSGLLFAALRFGGHAS